MISLAVGLKSYLIYFCSELEVVLVWNVWKKFSFFVQIWWILKLRFEDLISSLTDFYKWVHILLKKTTCIRLPNENVFCPNNASENYLFNSWLHQKLLLVANQYQDSPFLFEINSEVIGASKLISQLKLLPVSNTPPSLFFTNPLPLKSTNCLRPPF